MEFKTAKFIDAGHQWIEAFGADGQVYKIPADEHNADYRRLLDGCPDQNIKAVKIARFRSVPQTDAGDVGIGVTNPAAKLDVDGVVKVKSYTVATLPAVVAGGMIYVSNETGGAVLAFGDGTNWRRSTDRAVVA